MDIVIQIVAAICLMVALASAFFLLVVHPIWGIVDAATNEKLSGGAKAAIIVLTLILLGPIMSFFYALIGSDSRKFRKMTVAGAIMLVVSIAGVAIGAAMSPNGFPGEDMLPEATAGVEDLIDR